MKTPVLLLGMLAASVAWAGDVPSGRRFEMAYDNSVPDQPPSVKVRLDGEPFVVQASGSCFQTGSYPLVITDITLTTQNPRPARFEVPGSSGLQAIHPDGEPTWLFQAETNTPSPKTHALSFTGGLAMPAGTNFCFAGWYPGQGNHATRASLTTGRLVGYVPAAE